MDCIKRSNKQLQKHQRKFVEAFIRSKLRGSIAIHGAGSGKTLLAVATSKCYLDKYPNHSVIVITPASLLSGFKKELSEYDDDDNSQYKFYTYSSFANNPCRCANSLIIIDEAQSLKNADGVSYKVISKCAMTANKILMLSATPIINKLYDLEPLMSMLHRQPILSEYMYNEMLSNPTAMRKYFGCVLSFFKNDPEQVKEFFPSTISRYISFTMDNATSTIYNNLVNNKNTRAVANIFDIDTDDKKDLQSFFNGLRRVSSSSTQKIDYIIKFIRQIILVKRPSKSLGITQYMIDTHTDKFIIFTHFKTHGSNIIKKRLRDINIPYGYIDGSVLKTKRTKVADQYVAGDIKVILISAAGATGLNLFETGYMFLMEPSWNESEITQVTARANRYMSHSKLPKSKRNVLVLKLLLVKQHESKNLKYILQDRVKYESYDEPPSIDVKMVVDSIRKEKIITKHIKVLETKVKHIEQCTSAK